MVKILSAGAVAMNDGNLPLPMFDRPIRRQYNLASALILDMLYFPQDLLSD